MKLFIWQGIDLEGAIHTGSVKAASVDEVKKQLFNQGIALMTVRQRRWQWLVEILDRRTPKGPHLLFFFRHMALLLKSGLSLVQSLNVLCVQISSPLVQDRVQKALLSVQRGESFSRALGQFPELFNGMVIHLMGAGERVGGLAEVLEMMAYDLELSMDREKRIRQALFLPTITIFFAVLILGGVFLFVVPQFESFFGSMNKTLPESTRMVLAFSLWLRSESALFCSGVFVALCAGGLIAFRRIGRLRIAKDTFLLKAWYIGSFIRLHELARYTQMIAMLVKAGVPLAESLAIAEKGVRNEVLKNVVAKVSLLVRQGTAFSVSLQTAGSSLFPDELIALVAVGQESGSLGLMLEKVSDLFYQKFDERINLLISLLQPMLMIGVGLLIAFLMVAVYLPIFDMVSLV